MVKPNIKNNYWLFADSIIPNSIFEFVKEENYVSPTGTVVPCVVLVGQDKDKRIGDFQLSTWNIENLNELISQIGENWTNKKFSVAVSQKDKKKLVLTPIAF